MKFCSRFAVYLFIVIFFITSNHSIFCKMNLETEKCLIMKNNICVKLKTEVIAINRENQGGNIPNKLFIFDEPINKCKPEDCKYCCLSNNKCGKETHCENSK